MARYITKRVLRSLITMFIIITILFALLRLMPVEGYFENYDKMSSTQIQVKLQALGVTAPLPTQLLRFYKQVLHGDLGESNVYRKGVAITEIIAEKIPISLELGLISLCIAHWVSLLASSWREAPAPASRSATVWARCSSCWCRPCPRRYIIF